MKQLHCAIIFAVFISILSCSKAETSNENIKKVAPVDFYLVVDTSGSMADGTMKLVKEHLPALLNTVKVGDRVHLIQFDEVTQPVIDVTISNDSDKQMIEDTIQSLKPIGPYTDLAGLIANLKTAIKTTENKNFIIVLSDGIDDPKPADSGKKNRETVQLNEFEATEKLPVQAPYIYYIQLGGETKPDSEADLRTDLQNLSTDVTIVEPTIDHDGNTNIGIQEIQESIENRRTDSSFWLSWWQKIKEWAMIIPIWGWALGVAVLLLLLWFIFRLFQSSAKPLEGFLSFYEKSDHPSMAKQIKLSKFQRNNLTIGSESGSIVRIQDKTFPNQVKLKAKRSKNDFQFTASSSDLKRIEFMVQKKRGYISSGDTFRINNYTFEYS
ncbi:MAG: VWA domain-containing protein, partial [Leptonema sp. (in: Bacteria)]|nr:VWA domain-containing protein [Leptonema sp. (in: bacteria)]